MHNITKLKTIIITSLCLIIASCSSGGSGSTEGLNISGRWSGNLVDSLYAGGTSFNIVFDFSQIDTVGVPGNARISDVIIAYTITGVADSNGDQSIGRDCVVGISLSGEEAQINSNINPATLNGDGLTAVVIDNKIEGNLTNSDLGCGFGGPFTITRVRNN